MQTPYVLIDLDVVETKYHDLSLALPATELCCAVKANPGGPVIERLSTICSSFDVANVPEIDLVLSYGVAPSRVSFGNTMKMQRDITYAASHGITRFTVDSVGELETVLTEVPGAEICVRLFHECKGADWPLSKKFGCGPGDATRILIEAGRSGATTGMSFNVGSQQRNLNSWDEPLRVVAGIFDEVARHTARPEFVNLGGGFPGSYLDAMPAIANYGDPIQWAIREAFGHNIPRMMAEPGRYRLATDKDDDPMVAIVLAGRTCDSADIIYDKAGYRLPSTLEAGDIVRIASTGTYTTGYSAVGFNGFAPLEQVYNESQLPKSKPRSGAVSIG